MRSGRPSGLDSFVMEMARWTPRSYERGYGRVSAAAEVCALRSGKVGKARDDRAASRSFRIGIANP